MSISSEKHRLRERMLAYRRELAPDTYASISRRIAQRLVDLPDWDECTCVHAFWPMVEKREPDVRPFIAHLLDRGVRVVLPVVREFSRKPSGRNRLEHIQLEDPERLQTNRWGIQEPDGGTVVPVDELDAVLAPALAVDRRGFRLGHGFGYYDEFLSSVGAKVICPAFTMCLLDAVPHDEHDVPVACIVTEDFSVRTT